MTASTLKGAIKGTLKGILNTAAPVFSRRSAMDSASARETLLGFSPPPTGTAAADNRLLNPECDLQIVIPAYNVEAYLAQCMDSVLAQETKYTYRVILVDDGATDTTPAIADTYSDDPRVTVIHQRNKGLSGARNTGIREIFGKYLMFIDSDDFLLPGAIDAMLDTAFAHDCDLVEGGAYYVYDNRKSVMHRYESDHKVSDPYTLHGHAWGKLYRGALFEHLCFPEGYWYEDSLLSYLIFPNAKKRLGHRTYGLRLPHQPGRHCQVLPRQAKVRGHLLDHGGTDGRARPGGASGRRRLFPVHPAANPSEPAPHRGPSGKHSGERVRSDL